eukprot:3849283-Rhodomonas_salina.2
MLAQAEERRCGSEMRKEGERRERVRRRGAAGRYLISTMPEGSRIPPRAVESTYISITSALMVGSITTHAPPRSSPSGGM